MSQQDHHACDAQMRRERDQKRVVVMGITTLELETHKSFTPTNETTSKSPLLDKDGNSCCKPGIMGDYVNDNNLFLNGKHIPATY